MATFRIYRPLSRTESAFCEACWREPSAFRRQRDRALLCEGCAAADHPVRTEQFPPLGIYGLTRRRVGAGESGASAGPGAAPGDGARRPRPAPEAPPGTPPV